MKKLSEVVINFINRILPIPRIDFDDGSYIEYLDREVIRYSEKDGHQMDMDWYFNSRFGSGRLLYAEDINYWNSPHELEVLSEQKRKEIQQKIISYCQKRNIPIEIIPVGLKPPSS